MRYSRVFILASLASLTLANPLAFTKRTSIDECETQNNQCVTAPNANLSFCGAQHASCLASATSSPATPTSTSPPSTTPASTCDQNRLTCGAAPDANQSLCAVQKNACDACEAAYESYITTPGSNKAFAASIRNECFSASQVGTGDGVVPIISSISAAQAGAATATPTTATSASASPTTTAASTCDQNRLTCGAAPGANQSLCAAQKNACDACEAAYESYITTPGSNKSFAASIRDQCIAASQVGAGDGVAPIISSISSAQAGAASATPTTAASASGAPGASTTTSVVFANTTSTPGATNTPVVVPAASTTLATSAANSSPASPTPTHYNGAAVAVKPWGAVGLLALGAAFLL